MTSCMLYDPIAAAEARIHQVSVPVHDITSLIGETPLIEVPQIVPGGADVLVKHEGYNPGGSVRDRTMLEIIDTAVGAGLLRRGDEIVMAGANNSAVSGAMIAHARGFKITVFEPKHPHRRLWRLLRENGVRLRLVDADLGLDGAVRQAADYVREGANRVFLDGGRRSALGGALRHIAREIVDALDGQPLGAFVTSVSTGATLKLVSQSLRGVAPNRKVVGVRIDAPDERLPLYDDVSAKQALSHNDLSGFGEDVLVVSESETWQMRDEVARRTGMILGPKGASALVAARRIHETIPAGSAIVALSIDGGQRYLGHEPNDL